MPPQPAIDPKIARLAVSIALVLCSILGVRGCWGLFQDSDGDILLFSGVIAASVILLLVIAGVIAAKQIDFSGMFNPSVWFKANG
jgi:hypothetical protein